MATTEYTADLYEKARVVETRLGLLLRKEREKAKLSQHELSQRVRMFKAYIPRIERGRRECRVIDLLLIAHALDIDSGKLMRRLQRDLMGKGNGVTPSSAACSA